MHIFRAFVVQQWRGREFFFVLWPRTHTYTHVCTHPPYLPLPPLFLPQISAGCSWFYANKPLAGNNAFYLAYEDWACRSNKRALYEG